MSDEQKTVTEREAVLRERAAYARALEEYHFMSPYGSVDIASRAYALPKVERPRVVCDVHGNAGLMWKVDLVWPHTPHIVCSRDGGKTWSASFSDGAVSPMATPKRVEMWADLIARPTETVEDGQ